MNRAHLLLILSAGLLACDDEASGGDGGGPPASGCPVPAGPGLEHAGTIAADETWAAADGPHLLTFDVDVAEGARLTIEPCAEVRVQGGRSIVVEGSLVAEGTAETPIAIVADDAAAPWGHLQVFAPGTVRLAHVRLEGGGADEANAYGTLEARGDQLAPAQEILHVDHVQVLRSAGFGVSLRGGAAFTAGSRELTVSESAKAPLRILPRLASNVPTGTYTGNAVDAIQIETEAYGDVTLGDVTLRDRGVPYRVGGEDSAGTLVVSGEVGKVTLTLEPGVVLAFARNEAAALVIGAAAGAPSSAALVARGTAERPIVFTSASDTPAAADWQGLVFDGIPDPETALEHVEVRFAGGPSRANSHHCEPDGAFSTDEDAAISIYGQPASAFVTNSLVADSGRIGVNLAYQGDFVDFAPTNVFEAVPGCDVSRPRNPDGTCPASSACP